MLLLGFAAPVPAQPAPASNAPAEVRGTWLTTTANDAISTPAKTAQTMRRLREIGLNTVYVECWKNGYTEFPSDTMDELIGVPLKVNNAPADLQRDLLDETLNAAHREGLVYIAWFEYGFMAAYKDTHNELRENFRGWMTTTADGSLVSKQNPFVWMNPLRPESRELILGIVTEAIRNYDLDGVQLDDRIAWPTTMGYDPYTIEVYKSEHHGRAPPEDHTDPRWVQWRADKVSKFAKEFYDACKAANPDILVSISPAVYPWSLEHYACDWPRWAKAGWMDEFVPQVYRMDYPAFASSWKQQIDAIGPRKQDLIAGIRIVGDGPDTTWRDIKKKLDLTRTPGSAGGGHVHWFSRGVLDVYPEQLTAYYDVETNGPAPHPKFGAGHRPDSIPLYRVPGTEAEQNGGGAFMSRPQSRLPAGRYRLVGKQDNAWITLGSHTMKTWGDAQLMIHPDAPCEAFELLIDRRPTPETLLNPPPPR